jgi:hypothetical protein
MTPERKAQLTQQVVEGNIILAQEITDWELLGVYWTRDGKPIATVENDAKGNPFTTNFNLRPEKNEYTDNRGRVHVTKRDAKHFACKKCGVMVQWNKNKAGKFYLAPPMGKAPYHTCFPAWQAWYELQKDAIAQATLKVTEQGLKVTAETLGEAVDPRKTTINEEVTQ